MSPGLRLPREALGLGMTSQRARDRMVERLREQGIRDPRVLEVMRTLPRNDLRQYDDLAGEWWRPDGAFAMLHWLATARARLVPPASRPGAVLVDVGCGAGLLAPHLSGKGYQHVGVDLVTSALEQATAHGVTALRGDATALPLIGRGRA